MVGLLFGDSKSDGVGNKLESDETIKKKIEEINNNAERIPISNNKLMEEKYMVAKKECTG